MNKQSVFLVEGIVDKAEMARRAIDVLNDVRLDFIAAGMDTSFINEQIKHPERLSFTVL